MVPLLWSIAPADTTLIRTDLDMIYTTQHTFADVRSAGMGGSGVAVPGGITSTFLNPALVNTYVRMNEIASVLTTVAYGRDPVFADHVVPGGVSYSGDGVGTLGSAWRYLRDGESKNQYEAVVCYSGTLFEQSLDQGAVDFGVNLHYQQVAWVTHDFADLHRRTEKLIARDSVTVDMVVSDSADEGKYRAYRILLDIGMFQAQVSDNIDFGVTFHNALGYEWFKERPHLTVRDSFVVDTLLVGLSDTIFSTQEAVYDSSYTPGYVKGRDWVDKWYRRLTVGAAYRTSVLEENVGLTIPVDLEIIGLFDRGNKTHFVFRSGIEARIKENYILRFGYARQPKRLLRGVRKLENQNQFFGGAGFHLSPVSADFYFGKEQWALGVSFEH